MRWDYQNAKTDEELLHLIKSENDSISFSELYNRYWDKSLAISYNLTHNKSLAEDLVQELFISFWNRRKLLEINNFSSYLATAIKFSFYMHIEKERRRRMIREEKLPPYDEAILDEQIEALFCADYLSKLLEVLPEKCRLVVSYSRLDDMSNAEIAKKMNISEKTVEGHLTKGLKIIRSKFRKDLFGLLMLHVILISNILNAKIK